MKQAKSLNLKALAKLFCMVALLSATSCARTADDIDLSKEIPQERKMVPDTSIEERIVQLFSSLYESTLRNGESQYSLRWTLQIQTPLTQNSIWLTSPMVVLCSFETEGERRWM